MVHLYDDYLFLVKKYVFDSTPLCVNYCALTVKDPKHKCNRCPPREMTCMRISGTKIKTSAGRSIIREI